MKICSRCNIEKSEDQFTKAARYRNGMFCWCVSCVHEYHSTPEYLAKERERWKKKFSDPKAREIENAYRRERYTDPKERRRHSNERYVRQYGITLEFFENEGKKQNGCCKLCGRKRRLVADHNHTTKKYRGAICGMCNVAVGRIESVPDFIPKVQEYLQ